MGGGDDPGIGERGVVDGGDAAGAGFTSPKATVTVSPGWIAATAGGGKRTVTGPSTVWAGVATAVAIASPLTSESVTSLMLPSFTPVRGFAARLVGASDLPAGREAVPVHLDFVAGAS